MFDTRKQKFDANRTIRLQLFKGIPNVDRQTYRQTRATDTHRLGHTIIRTRDRLQLQPQQATIDNALHVHDEF